MSQRILLLFPIVLALLSVVDGRGKLETLGQEPGTIPLFNGKDLSGWTAYLWDGQQGQQDTTTAVGDVWRVEDGVLTCRGNPTGYLKTKSEYENYVLQLQWRWPADTRNANNGVLVHVSSPNALGPWPKSIEVQLQTGDAGDFWVIGTGLDVPNLESRKQGRRHLNLTDDSEKPIGQWNQMKITCRGDEILVHINGILVNHATNCSQTRGAIALQSEGRPIHFRKIELTPIREQAPSRDP